MNGRNLALGGNFAFLPQPLWQQNRLFYGLVDFKIVVISALPERSINIQLWDI